MRDFAYWYFIPTVQKVQCFISYACSKAVYDYPHENILAFQLS